MTMRYLIRFLALGLMLVFATGAFAATETQGKRVALVIGNGKYAHANKLPNPPKDAADMGKKLKELGFDVVLGLDLDMADFGTTLREFSKHVEGADVALLFYAGHGLQVDGTNFLIPVDAKIEASSDLDFQAVKLDSLISLMDKSAKLSLIFLDACRNNPLARSLNTRGVDTPGGLAPQSIASGSYIAFATAPGNVAYDGQDESNSPFTTALLQNIGRENVDIRLMMADVRAEVFEVTKEKQLPWENNSLIGRFYFRTGKNIETDQVAKEAALVERDAFDQARKKGTAAALNEFLVAYPDGLFAGIARDTIASLEGTDVETSSSIDDVFWRTVRDSVLPADFQLYLDIFDKGKFRDLAQARIVSLNNAASIQNYVLEDGTTLNSRASIREVALAKVDQLPVMFVQYGLIALGFDIAEPGGILDPPTKKAIRGYQASMGYPQTGQLTPRETVDVILAAAAIGDQHAETAVGVMTASGIGLDQDDQVARMWLSRASDSGNKYAQANLAVLLRDGRGGKKDVDRARSLLKLAVDQGLPDAEPLLRDLGG